MASLAILTSAPEITEEVTVEPTESEMARILRTAANRVETAWYQGDLCAYLDRDLEVTTDFDIAPVCLVGAIHWALSGNPWDPQYPVKAQQLVDTVDGYLRTELEWTYGPAEWNDVVAEDRLQVAGLLRDVASAVS